MCLIHCKVSFLTDAEWITNIFKEMPFEGLYEGSVDILWMHSKAFLAEFRWKTCMLHNYQKWMVEKSVWRV